MIKSNVKPKSIYKDAKNIDPVCLADSWVTLNQSAFIVGISRVPEMLHCGLVKTIKQRNYIGKELRR